MTMDDEILQLGGSTQKQTLTISNSFVQRARPANLIDLSNQSSTPYVINLLSHPSSLLSYTDDGLFRFHDKSTLRIINSFTWQQGGKCSAIKTYDNAKGDFIASGSSGKIGYWESNQQQIPAISFESPSNCSYLSIACSKADNTIAAGTELQGSEAKIDLWDLRKPNVPILTYIETHSDDITSLDFHPSSTNILLSAASDSLIAISDTKQSNEDDSVIGVINAGASLARAGWGGSSKQFPKQEEEMSMIPSLGAFYGVTDMQTIAIWEADGFTELLPTRDVRQTQMELGIPSHRQWQTEYIIDAGYSSTLLENSESVGLFCGTQDGNMALMEIAHDQSKWSLHCLTSGGHSDIVRSVAWDQSSLNLYSGGEDGKVCVWSLAGDQSFTQQHSLNALANTLSANVSSDPDHFDSLDGGPGPKRNPLKGSSYGSTGRATSGKDTQRNNYRPY